MQRITKTQICISVLYTAAMLLSCSSLLALNNQEDDRLDHHRNNRGYLGVQLINLTPELCTHFGVPRESGLIVAKVSQGSAAEDSGIQVGDILTNIDGEDIESSREISRFIRRKDAGDTVNLVIWREGSRRNVTATLTESEMHDLDFEESLLSLPVPGLGFIHGPHLDELEWNWSDEGFILTGEVTEAVEEAMEQLREELHSKEWRQKLESIKEMDWERITDRMQEVEKRLSTLEEELVEEMERKIEKNKLIDSVH